MMDEKWPPKWGAFFGGSLAAAAAAEEFKVVDYFSKRIKQVYLWLSSPSSRFNGSEKLYYCYSYRAAAKLGAH